MNIPDMTPSKRGFPKGNFKFNRRKFIQKLLDEFPEDMEKPTQRWLFEFIEIVGRAIIKMVKEAPLEEFISFWGVGKFVKQHKEPKEIYSPKYKKKVMTKGTPRLKFKISHSFAKKVFEDKEFRL